MQNILKDTGLSEKEKYSKFDKVNVNGSRIVSEFTRSKKRKLDEVIPTGHRITPKKNQKNKGVDKNGPSTSNAEYDPNKTIEMATSNWEES